MAERAFLDVAAESHFSLQNIPFGIFAPPDGPPRVGSRLGEWVVDLQALAEAALFDGVAPALAADFAAPALNRFMGRGQAVWRATRLRLQHLLAADEPTLRDDAALRARALFPAAGVTMRLPAEIGDYTDFYSSREHATNVGTMFRGADNALMPNWRHLPVAYHGRASSVVVSGTPVRRPVGQSKAPEGDVPTFGPSRLLDFELEMGALVGTGNPLGQPIPVGEATQHLFGLALVNDWSARDIQAWEYQPLGPFLAKNFATSLAPWVVTLDALEPFRVAAPVQDPEPLPYLRDRAATGYDIHLEVWLASPAMREPMVIARSNHRHLYWTLAQQVAHHTITGCNLHPGDLLASGTISGPTPDSYGSLLELTWRGTQPITLPTGETRTFLQDGDRLTLTGWAQGDGFRVGFGEVTAEILPAHAGWQAA